MVVKLGVSLKETYRFRMSENKLQWRILHAKRVKFSGEWVERQHISSFITGPVQKILLGSFPPEENRQVI
jgi:hypothetical protein